MTTAPVITIAARTHALGPLLIFMSAPLVGDDAASGVKMADTTSVSLPAVLPEGRKAR
jgi:hypothetical protein